MIAAQYVDKTTHIQVRTGEGTFEIHEKDYVPEDYHVNYGNIYYDCYGTITDAPTSLATYYKGEDGSPAQVIVNKDGSGTLPGNLNSLNESNPVVITLNEPGAAVTVPESASEYTTTQAADGLELVDNGDGSYDVQEERAVQIGDRYYADLEKAVAAAEDGETIKLLEDITLDATLTIGSKAMTIDLNGYDISGAVATNGPLLADAGAKLTITDGSDGEKGSIINTGKLSSRAVRVNAGAELILDGGIGLRAEPTQPTSGAALYIVKDDVAPADVTIKDANLSVSKGSVIRYSTSSKRASKLLIEGGTFRSEGKKATENLFADEDAENITIKGGTFYSWHVKDNSPAVEEGSVLVINEDASITIRGEVPADYVAGVEEQNTYLAAGDLHDLLQYVDTEKSPTIVIAKDVMNTYASGDSFGIEQQSGAIPALTFDIAKGATLSGNMPLCVADVLVTGEGTVADGFFAAFDETYAVTSEQTDEGTLYKGRIASQKVVAEVICGDDVWVYSDIASAISKAGQNADSVLKLRQDVENDRTVGTAKNNPCVWTLDLNGHKYTYTGTGDAFQVGNEDKSLTIADSSQDGGGILEASGANAAISTTNSSNGAKVTIEKGVTINGIIFIAGTDPTLDVSGTVNVSKANAAAISTNGTSTNNSTINLNDGAVIKATDATSHGIFHPGTGTLNVYDGAKVAGGDVGIEMRAGTLNVYDGAEISGGDGEPSSSSNGSGSTSHNAAVAIAQHVTDEAVAFNAYGGTFTGGAAVYESDPEKHSDEVSQLIELNIEDGVFDGKVESETQEGFISGGTFTVQPANEDIYPGLQAVEDAWDFATDTATGNMTLLAMWSLNAPDVNVSADTTSIGEGENAVLAANVSHDLDSLAYTYQWYKDGKALDGETNDTLTASEAGKYTVKVTSDDGQKTSAEVESAAVEITEKGQVIVP